MGVPCGGIGDVGQQRRRQVVETGNEARGECLDSGLQLLLAGAQCASAVPVEPAQHETDFHVVLGGEKIRESPGLMNSFRL